MSHTRVVCAEEAALLAAVRACPDDDAPRLVYADWLEENQKHVGKAGRARLGMIRLDRAISLGYVPPHEEIARRNRCIQKYARDWYN